MPELNYLAVVVSIVGAFVLSGIWYGVLGNRMAALHPAYAEPSRSPYVTAGVELSRNLVLTLAVAGLADRLDVDDLAGGLLLGLVLWIGFPLVLLTGSVFHEKVPPALAAIHAGNWLLKLLLIGGVAGVWT